MFVATMSIRRIVSSRICVYFLIFPFAPLSYLQKMKGYNHRDIITKNPSKKLSVLLAIKSINTGAARLVQR